MHTLRHRSMATVAATILQLRSFLGQARRAFRRRSSPSYPLLPCRTALARGELATTRAPMLGRRRPSLRHRAQKSAVLGCVSLPFSSLAVVAVVAVARSGDGGSGRGGGAGGGGSAGVAGWELDGGRSEAGGLGGWEGGWGGSGRASHPSLHAELCLAALLRSSVAWRRRPFLGGKGLAALARGAAFVFGVASIWKVVAVVPFSQPTRKPRPNLHSGRTFRRDFGRGPFGPSKCRIRLYHGLSLPRIARRALRTRLAVQHTGHSYGL